jgi:mRNA-degrading endonuclease RelE of RelBE toxin-antitoxin system
MRVDYLDRAEEHLSQFDDYIEEAIRDKVDELEDEGTSHNDTKLIRVEGRPVFRLKIGERNQKIDHRAVFDIKNGKFLIIAVIHRDEGYKTIEL